MRSFHSMCGRSRTRLTCSVFYFRDLHRLDSILKKRSLTPAKLDEIKIKSNILRAFTEPQNVEDAETKRDTAEL